MALVGRLSALADARASVLVLREGAAVCAESDARVGGVTGAGRPGDAQGA